MANWNPSPADAMEATLTASTLEYFEAQWALAHMPPSEQKRIQDLAMEAALQLKARIVNKMKNNMQTAMSENEMVLAIASGLAGEMLQGYPEKIVSEIRENK